MSYLSWYENGNKENQINYYDGEIIERNDWDSKGNLEQIKYSNNGEMIERNCWNSFGKLVDYWKLPEYYSILRDLDDLNDL